MKVKTSVTLSASVLDEIDKMEGPRSKVIEQAVLEFLQRQQRQAREQRDLNILNRAAEQLNRETEEILGFQVKL